MGMWTMVVHGIGAHHNPDYENDANKLLAEFVAKLKALGHSIEHACFTHGSRDDMTAAPVAPADPAPAPQPAAPGTGDPAPASAPAAETPAPATT